MITTVKLTLPSLHTAKDTDELASTLRQDEGSEDTRFGSLASSALDSPKPSCP